MRKSFEDFVSEIKNIHGDKYNYEEKSFVKYSEKMNIICPHHGKFSQSPSEHKKYGCKKCGIESQKKDRNYYIAKFNEKHGDLYDYSKSIIDKYDDTITITCNIHGDFEQKVYHHYRGSGCQKCAIEKSLKNIQENINDFRNIHGDKYEYEISENLKSRDKIQITCKKHGKFFQKINNHKNGDGCPKCANNGKPSLKENELYEFILRYYPNSEQSYTKISDISEIDIYIPEKKVGIEFNGLFWHSNKFKDSKYHLDKTISCQENGITLVHIFEDEWDNKKEIVKSRLLNILDSTPNKIYARKTIVKNVSSTEAKLFLNKNHIQGAVGSKYKIGLYVGEELVSLMTFGNLRKNLGNKSKENSYELLRFCNKLNTTVIGGASKLFKYFLNNYNPKNIVSYADMRWSKGNLYHQLGFNNIGLTKPNYFYMDNSFKKRENRFNYRKDVLVKKGYDATKTEKEIMNQLKYCRIYDCGTLKFEYKNEQLEI